MLSDLKKEIEEAAFMLANKYSKRDIHAKLIKCMALIEIIDNDKCNKYSDIDINERYNISIRDEIKKVSNRLKLWSKPERQLQYNSQILNSYLSLRRSGKKLITENEIAKELNEPLWFSDNFMQMKCLAERNHGKIFDKVGEYVEIWAPIKSAISDYEKEIYTVD